MKSVPCLVFLVATALACGSTVPSSSDAARDDRRADDTPSDNVPPQDRPESALSDVPLFYGTIEVGTSDSEVSDGVRATIVVREYGALRPGAPIALRPGEALVINGVPLVGRIADDGSPAYEAQHVPEASDGMYRFAWTRPSGNLAFSALKVPRLNVTVPTSIQAETPFGVTTTSPAAHLSWKTNSACAERRVESGFEAEATNNVLTLLQSPCEADLAFTSETSWDVAFVDPATDNVVDRGHVSIVTRSLAWRRVNVVP